MELVVVGTGIVLGTLGVMLGMKSNDCWSVAVGVAVLLLSLLGLCFWVL